MNVGSRGSDVTSLQQFLNIDSTGYFGKLTKQAVTDFQAKNDIEQLGFVGPRTRAALNSACTVIQNTSVETIVPATPTLTVTPAAHPAPSLALPSALFVPFTRFTLSAGSEEVEIKNIVVGRVGAGQNQAFEYIGILDGEGAEITYGYLGSASTAVMKDSITVPANESITYTIVGGMVSDLTNYEGQVPQLSLVSLEASALISGTFPILGTPQRVTESLHIGTAEMGISHFDPRGAFTRYIDDSNVRMSGVRIAAGSKEDLILREITWNQTGTAGATDIANVHTVINDVSYPTENDGRWYTSSLPSIRVPKGTSIDIYVAVDMLPGAANRTLKFDLRESTDIVVYGAQYGFGIAPYPTSNTAETGESVFLTSDGTTDGDSLFPYYSGPTASIYGATVSGFSKQ